MCDHNDAPLPHPEREIAHLTIFKPSIFDSRGVSFKRFFDAFKIQAVFADIGTAFGFILRPYDKPERGN
jgi:hypothetical protein